MKRKYVVGYDHEDKFIILYECNNLQLALHMADKLDARRKEKIKVKKRY